jgi:HPt (histidine-containing phosphotransfer) domain-containing protein
MIAHKLKGSALNIGAALFAETCRKIEIKGRSNDSEGMKELVDQLEKDFIVTREELNKL